MSSVYSVGYQDGTGTLWLDGFDASGNFQYDSFARGKFTPVSITGGTIGYPGDVQWSAKTRTMNVDDEGLLSTPTIYQVSATGKIIGSTVLACNYQSPGCDVAGFAIKGPGIVAVDLIHGSVALFSYPSGGQPVRSYGSGINQPFGVAISPDAP
jgi:hypothetical protein